MHAIFRRGSLAQSGRPLIARASRRNIATNAGTMRPATLPPPAFSVFSLVFAIPSVPSSLTKRLGISLDFHLAYQSAPVASCYGLSLVSPTRTDGNHRHLCCWGTGVDGSGGFSSTGRSPKNRHSYPSSPPASFHATVPGRHPARHRDSSKHGNHIPYSPSRRHKVRHFLAVTMSSGVRRLCLSRAARWSSNR
jgi:hypothetical protein